MILDKVFHGVLDQGRGCLLVFDQPEADVSPCSLPYSISYLLFELYVFGIQNTYGAAIDTLEQVGKVVDSLYAKVRYFVITSLFFCASFCRSFIDSSSFRFTRFLGQCANDPKWIDCENCIDRCKYNRRVPTFIRALWGLTSQLHVFIPVKPVSSCRQLPLQLWKGSNFEPRTWHHNICLRSMLCPCSRDVTILLAPSSHEQTTA